METIKIAEGTYPSNEFCHSCSMLFEYGEPGTNADGSKSEDFCHYCYKDGAFTWSDGTMEGMIEGCIPFKLQAGVYPDVETAREAMMAYFPELKRWKK